MKALQREAKGIPPSAREIAVVMGLKAATVYTLLRRLKAKGYVERKGPRKLLELI